MSAPPGVAPPTPFMARRQALGLSLEMVSEELRISVPHLRAIEAGTLDALPEGPYRAGWVRAYAAHIGLNPSEVAAQMGMGEAPASGVDPLIAARAAAATACVLLAIALGWSVWPSRSVEVSEPGPEVAVPSAPSAPAVPALEAPASPAAAVPDQRVRVVVQRPGPLVARVDGAIAVDRKVRPGEEILLEGYDRVEVELWSTDAARVVWNDEAIQPLGRQDTPRKLVFSDDRGQGQ